MSLDSQHRAAPGQRPGDEPTDEIRQSDPSTDEIPGDHVPEGPDEPGRGPELEKHDEPDERTTAGSDRPSGLQVTASALAAVTATALLSTLGVAGTLVGAAISSIVTVFANYLYSNSLRRTAERVAAAPPVQKVRARTRTGTTAVLKVPAGHEAAGARDGATVALATGQGATVRPVDGTGPGRADRTEPAPAGGRLERLRGAWRSVVDRYGYRRIVVTVLAFFAAVLAVVTLIELAAGKPLSDVVRNEKGTGTSLFGGSVSQESETTDPASEDPETGTGTRTDPDAEQGTDGELTEPAQPVPGEQPPAEPGDSVPEPTPSPSTTPEDGPTPSPSPSEPTDPGESPSPGQVPDYQPPADGDPAQPATPGTQPQSVPEPAPAE